MLGFLLYLFKEKLTYNMNKDVKVIDLKREYDSEFVPSQEYLDSMPDLQNGEFISLPIPFVGIQNFKVPVTVRQKDGGTQQVLATIYAENDLDSEHFGINMSRLIREWIPTRDVIFDINKRMSNSFCNCSLNGNSVIFLPFKNE